MLQVQNLSKSFGDQLLFENATWVLGKGEKLGLVGRNGSGKSTLFKILCGTEIPDSGEVSTPNNYKLGLLQQHLIFSCPNVLEEACTVLEKDEHGLVPIHLAEAILGGLGFSPEDQQKHPTLFSGGYQIRINLAKLLLSEPDLLLLDEPTNYLDIVSMRWLERFLRQWNGSLILITHDRDFMTRVCTHTLGIHRKGFRKIQGSPEDLYQLLEQEEELYAKTLENDLKKREQTLKFVNRFRAQANKAKQVQSRLKQLNKQPQLQALENEKELGFNFPFSESPGKRPIQILRAQFKYPEGPQIIQDYNLEVFHGDRIAIVGPNGKGKSTLLQLILGDLALQEGERLQNERTAIGYFGQTHIQQLHPLHTIEEEISQALPPNAPTGRARSIAGLMLFEGDQSQKQVQVLSGGERSRVLLGKLLAKPSNCLLLDEPTHHLDMESVEALIQALEEYEGTVLIVTHSEEIARRLATKLIVFDQGQVRNYEMGYSEFITTYGWSQDSNQQDKKPNERKESRRDRALKVQERNKILKPLELKIKHWEEKIIQLESQKENEEKILIQASEFGDAKQISLSSQKMNQLDTEIDNAFLELENWHEQLDEKKAFFDD